MVIDHPIFLESIRFIRSHLLANDLNYLEKKVLERLVHTSGDFTVQNLLNFSEGACEKGLQALKNGAPILTDKIRLGIKYSPLECGLEKIILQT